MTGHRYLLVYETPILARGFAVFKHRNVDLPDWYHRQADGSWLNNYTGHVIGPGEASSDEEWN